MQPFPVSSVYIYDKAVQMAYPPQGVLVDTHLGEFEQFVLLALLRLEDNAYGVTICRDIARRTGRDVTLGAVYKTLARLEEKGYVCSRVGEPTAERGGRRKKFYNLEPLGHRALAHSLDALLRMSKGLRKELEAL